MFAVSSWPPFSLRKPPRDSGKSLLGLSSNEGTVRKNNLDPDSYQKVQHKDNGVLEIKITCHAPAFRPPETSAYLLVKPVSGVH